uniref:Uncharacterized protein n=2 Tax=Coccolithus braarudii TaxID=221442 RepID=A0A7S0LJ12_9EUKA|mmetsp:Transcript_43231/g.92072  ORF Transcript_43231/g.92072 Transcript_43231/m.92072 type:complete len:211 (+) Transcript_43231:151-783(+)
MHARLLSPRLCALVGLAGGTLFSIGSGCFIAQSFVTSDDWLLIYRAGCGCWVVGCCPYVLLSIFVGRSQPLLCCYSHVPLMVIVQVGGLSCYITGCILGYVDPIHAVIPSTNLLFAVGAGSQLLDAVVDAARRRHRTIDLAVVVEIVAGAFFCLAAGLGGYASHVSLVRIGMTCWLIGSLGYLSLSFIDYRQATRQPASPPVMLAAIGVS